MNNFKKRNIIEQKEMNSEKWPSPEKRTVKNVLVFMSGKIGLLVWDILTICFFVAYLCATLMLIEQMGILKGIFIGVQFFLLRFVYRLPIMLYYHVRNYTKCLLKNYEACGGRMDHSVLLENLEYSLKNQMLYYSRQWIITERFFLAWHKSDLFFHPIAIPFQEMQSLRLEVRRRHIHSAGTVWNNVIVCRLKNGTSIDLFVGSKFKGDVTAKILQYFSIPFENTLEPKACEMPSVEITATQPTRQQNHIILPDLEKHIGKRERICMKEKEKRNNIDRGEKIRKLSSNCEMIILGIYAGIAGLLGLFLVIAYGLPLNGFEKNQNSVNLGFFLLGTALLIGLLYVVSGAIFTYFDKKREQFSIEKNFKKWPSPKRRTLKRTLTYMSRKAGLLVWDICAACIIFAYVVAFASEMEHITEMITTIVQIGVFWLAVRFIFMSYYSIRNYTKRLLKNYDECNGQLRDYVLLERLEDSLQEKLLYYSPQWIITEEFFLTWCKSDLFFSPVAISFQEMRSLRLEVRKRTIPSTGVVWNNVIVCQLKNGNSVDLYVGDKVKANVIVKILEYFNISFENTLNPIGTYMPPEEITATSPEKRLQQKRESVETQMKKEKMAIFAPVMNKTTTQDRERILELLASGRKIQAIKELREATGIGLAEAKNIVDQYDL